MTDNEARVNITYMNENGDMVDTVFWDSTQDQVLAMAKEAIRSGSVPGISARDDVDFTDYLVRRVERVDGHGFIVAPKTPFGG